MHFILNDAHKQERESDLKTSINLDWIKRSSPYCPLQFILNAREPFLPQLKETY